MTTPKLYTAIREAIERYMDENGLHTDYMKSIGCDAEGGRLVIFDVPENRDFGIGLNNDDYTQTKPVLIATLRPGGDIVVEETEHTAAYMVKRGTTDSPERTIQSQPAANCRTFAEVVWTG